MRYRILGPKGHLVVRSISGARLKKILPGLRRRFGHVRVIALVIRPTPRQKVVAWAKWGVRNSHAIHYSERAVRSEWLHYKPGTLPITTDCSGFVTLCYKWAGLPDPNGEDYKILGYTGTLLDHGRSIDLSHVRPADPIVYGPATGWHTAVVIKDGNDPLTVSLGDEAGPEYVRVSQDGRQPQRYRSYLP